MNKLKNAIRWYAAKWMHPLWIFIPLAALFFGYILLIPWDLRFGKLLNWLSDALFLLLIIHIVGTGIAGIVLFFKKHPGRAFAYLLEAGAFFFIFVFMCIVGMFTSGFADNDHFADKLQLPTDVVLEEPLDGGYDQIWKKEEVTDEFQKQIIAAIGTGPKLEQTDECHLLALERLMATPEGRQKVLDYVAASPDWTLRYNEADKLYATRNSHFANGIIDYSENHAIFPATNVQTGQREGIHAQYSVRIYFDGTPNRWFAKGKKDFDCIVHPKTNGSAVYSVDTWMKAGDAKIFIYDESTHAGRQMTVKMLELLEQEFETLEKGKDLREFGEMRPMEVKLYNGMQGGMYLMDIWCNPGETGTLSLRAKELTKGTQLSEHRLTEHQVKTYGCQDKDYTFHSQIDFTIYEGNWEQYYGAQLELWFTPDSAKEPRMLWTKNYRIQGWMR